MSDKDEATRPVCKLTECQGKPRCRMCLAMDARYAAPPVKPDGEPCAWLVEGWHDGKLIAHIVHLTLDEAKASAAVFSQHYTTTKTVPLCASPPNQSERIAAPTRLWLWRNWVDGRPEYLAFDNPYPLFMDSDDPQTLGEPCGYAIVKPSRRGRPDVSDEDAAKRIKSDAERIAALEREVEALRVDAERWRYVVTHAGWYRRDDGQDRYSQMCVRLPYEADQSCVATRTAAIDAARGMT